MTAKRIPVFCITSLAAILFLTSAGEVFAVGSTPALADLNGTWKLIESGSSVEYRFTITMNGPVALIVTETGYIAFGLVLPAADGEHAFDILWRFRSSAGTGGGYQEIQRQCYISKLCVCGSAVCLSL